MTSSNAYFAATACERSSTAADSVTTKLSLITPISTRGAIGSVGNEALIHDRIDAKNALHGAAGQVARLWRQVRRDHPSVAD